jgi:hypothetical protein
MTVHTELTPAEAADRLALRELFDAYAHCADRRDTEGQKALFAEDTRFEHYARPGAEAVARHVARTDPAAQRRQPER